MKSRYRKQKPLSNSEHGFQKSFWQRQFWVIGSIYRHPHSDIADAIEMLLSNSQIFLEDAEAVAAALANYKKRPSLRFSDCLILESARKTGHLPLGTFDRGLAKLDGTHKL